MGIVEYRFGHIENAQQNYQLAQKAYQKAGDVERVIVVLQNMAITYGDTGQVGKALEVFKKAYRNADRIDSKDYKARIALNIGSLLNDAGRCEEALESFAEASSYYEEFDLRPERIRMHTLTSNALASLERLDEAKQELINAQKLLQKLEQPELSLKLELEQSNLAIMQSDLEKAVLHLEHAISMAQSLDAKFTLLDAYFLLSGVCFALTRIDDFEVNLRAAELLGQELKDDLAKIQVEYLRALEENNSEQLHDLRNELADTSQNYFIRAVERALTAGKAK